MRFTAMVVVPDPFARAQLVRRLRPLGAREVAEAATVLQARAWARTFGPRDLCIAEPALPDGSGLALLAELRRAGWPGCLAVSQVGDLRMVAAALHAGVRGFILSRDRRLGQTEVPPAGTAWPARTARPASGDRVLGGLSRREVEVIRHVADGRSNRDIGTAMGLSELTVKSHLARIARKLGTGDRAGMVAISLRNGVIT
ncbi:MAG TPA: response regulator transcription factor [Actinomycetes bacterium]|jgi:DNA-binding NarL/FixJ family response regulator|nr:response regulator transcription factor [Actinomycetes bacterium]